jgi:hypothetical protein
MFGLIYDDIVKIRRTVEVFQWIEAAHRQEEGPTTYSYKKDWKSHAVDQDRFVNQKPKGEEGPTNPKDSDWPCKSETFMNNKVDLGGYELSQS